MKRQRQSGKSFSRAKRRRTSMYFSVLLVWNYIFVVLSQRTAAFIDSDGKCRIKFFAPFTTSNGGQNIGLRGDPRVSTGFSNMAAALLAVEHFNTRNSSIIPELSNFTDCSIELEIDSVFDTGSEGHIGSRMFLKDLLRRNQTKSDICALAGGHHDTPAQDLSLLAYATETPLVVSRSWNVFTTSDDKNPFTTSVYPDTFASTTMLVSYLLFKGRTDYVALLHPASTPGLQRRSSLGIMLDASGITWMSSEFLNEADTESDSALGQNELGKRNIQVAVKRIKDSGYHTIILAVDDPLQSFPKIANAVEEFGMNNGEYFFVVLDTFEPSVLRDNDRNENVTKMLNGAAYIVPYPPDFSEENGIEGESSGPLKSSWVQQGARFADQLNSLNPIEEGEDGYFFADPDFFKTVLPDCGAAFAYDAVMTIGGGACLAQRSKTNTISGWEHQLGIRKFEFFGATGSVKFGRKALQRGGARNGDFMAWVSLNLLGSSPFFQIADVHTMSQGWTNRRPYIYSDGSNTPPADLRDQPNQNYLDAGIRATGLSIMTIVLVLTICVTIWVYFARESKVLAASQPVFLYMICFGVIIQSSSVVTWAFDEQDGLDQEQLSKLCMAFPWMFSTGWIIIYAALFTKLWRVDRVLQFSRQHVKFSQVMWPMVLLCLLTLLVLTLWNIFDPLEWNRKEINSFTGESIGMCDSSSNVTIYLVPLVLVLLIPSILMAVMAYRTKDVDEAYSESKWIFILIFVQFEVVLVAAPVAIRLSNEESNMRFLAFTGLTLSFPLTTLSFIFGPKISSYIKTLSSAGSNTNRPKRGERSANVRVTGIGASDAIELRRSAYWSAESTPRPEAASQNGSVNQSRISREVESINDAANTASDNEYSEDVSSSFPANVNVDRASSEEDMEGDRNRNFNDSSEKIPSSQSELTS